MWEGTPGNGRGRFTNSCAAIPNCRVPNCRGTEKPRRHIAALGISCDFRGPAHEKEAQMPYAVANDSVRLYFEEAGSGTPILFLHEFAADHTNWDRRCATFRAVTVSSPIRRAATRPRTCRRRPTPT